MIFFSLDDVENMMEKKIQWKILKKIIVIFSPLFSLKNNEENKRKEKGKGGGRILSGSSSPGLHL